MMGPEEAAWEDGEVECKDGEVVVCIGCGAFVRMEPCPHGRHHAVDDDGSDHHETCPSPLNWFERVVMDETVRP